MNIEQQQAAFEAWWESTPILKENKRTIAEKAYQAGRCRPTSLLVIARGAETASIQNTASGMAIYRFLSGILVLGRSRSI